MAVEGPVPGQSLVPDEAGGPGAQAVEAPVPEPVPAGPARREIGPRGRRARARRVARRRRALALREAAFLAVAAVLGAVLIKAFLVEAFYIPSGSMEQTLHGCEGCSGNDRVLVWKLGTRLGDPERGDIVVFGTEGTRYAQLSSERDVIKRVIGVGGDEVRCCDPQGRVVVNGEPLDEPYVYEDNSMAFGPVTVPADQLWVMGDHRSDSQDSRFVGPIPVENVVGQAFVRVWPLHRLGLLH
ncbi:signal peptidase I [Motilibacter sp. E257]|uniref:Signal peptidase I n=1 Tax=Motilibacter deserti TaxID=2714956 RepID=A0ABX0GVM8_9ACTN|nr:signal peptidase I [Motilibacter deserti]